tara:strand:- start:141 stop:302 length:162 start_codon:yes stop_codon:yes gene_type:complete
MEEPKNNEEEAEDTEAQEWLVTYPDMQRWVETHSDMVDWMTEVTKFPPRSDCG